MARRSAADAAVTREKILATARALFAARGYADTGARDIAAAAGVTVGAVFHHFESKGGLFRAVFEQLNHEMADILMKAYATVVTTDPIEAMIVGLRAALTFTQREDFHRVVAVDGPVVLGAEEWNRIDARMGLAIVESSMKTLKRAGLIGDQPTLPLAILLMGAMNNAGFALARGDPKVDLEDLLDAYRNLVKGLAPRPVE
jgi:AcrR family transcriptional regulator